MTFVPTLLGLRHANGTKEKNKQREGIVNSADTLCLSNIAPFNCVSGDDLAKDSDTMEHRAVPRPD